VDDVAPSEAALPRADVAHAQPASPRADSDRSDAAIPHADFAGSETASPRADFARSEVASPRAQVTPSVAALSRADDAARSEGPIQPPSRQSEAAENVHPSPPPALRQLPEMPPMSLTLPPDSGLVLIETAHAAGEATHEMAPEPARPKRVRPPRLELAAEPLEIVETRKEGAPPV